MKSLFLYAFVLFLISCSSYQQTPAAVEMLPLPLDKALAPKLVESKLADFTCEMLIEKSKDESFALNGLAALKAKKNCKDFSFDIKKLSDFEKRIYSEQIQEFEPIATITPSSLSVAELKANLKLAKTNPEKIKAYKQLRSKQKSMGARNDFLKTTADFYNWAKAELKKAKTSVEARTAYYEASLLFAKTFWTENKLDRADSILNDSLRMLKGITSVAEIYFVTGRMAEEKQNTEKAVQMYDLALEDMKAYKPKITSFNTDRLLWLKAWILYKEKKWADSEKAFTKLYENSTDLSEKSRAQFFRARALNQLERKDEAKVILEKIVQEDFYGYYGLVSYYELGIKMPALSKIKFDKKFIFDLNLTFLKPIEKNIFTELIRYGEIDIAEKTVGILSRTSENQLNLGLYLADKGSRYLPLFAAFAKLDNSTRVEVMLTYGNLLYPQPYLEKVKAMSAKTLIPTSLIYSIMKQESAFNEKTRSPADAYGLMQMIPRLAKQLSKKFDVAYKNQDDLYKPEINITLGSYELMEQIKKQDGQLTYVAAAYNAGPGALSNWLKTRNRSNILEFIEEIPYDETRTYVKLIARNMLFYDRISKRDEEQSFPANFLALIDSKKDISIEN
ncbi:MAG: lytic transglycosylase domain-containing protein [Pseudobdellovibrio sp.]